MFLTRHSRGQTLPIWAMGIAAALTLAFAAIQYGEVLRWQVRAQNAADAAAVAALSVQTQTWNQQLALVYAASVEEWRIKNLLNALQAAAYADPGCRNGGSDCQAGFDALRQQYYRAVQRYTTDVQLVNRTAHYTFDQAQADAKAIVASLQTNCGAAIGGDCAFTYNVVSVAPRPTVNDVEQSARRVGGQQRHHGRGEARLHARPDRDRHLREDRAGGAGVPELQAADVHRDRPRGGDLGDGDAGMDSARHDRQPDHRQSLPGTGDAGPIEHERDRTVDRLGQLELVQRRLRRQLRTRISAIQRVFDEGHRAGVLGGDGLVERYLGKAFQRRAQHGQRVVRFLTLRSRGQALVETAIALPVFLLVMFGVVWSLQVGVLGERVEMVARYGGMVSARINPYQQYSLYAVYSAAGGAPPATSCVKPPSAIMDNGGPLAAPAAPSSRSGRRWRAARPPLPHATRSSRRARA